MNKFTYQYQSPTPTERREIEAIRQKYVIEEAQEEIKKIKTYDKRAKRLPFLFLLTFAGIGILIFGTGLTCILEWNRFVLGCCIMLFGTGVICFVVLFYSKCLTWCKKYYGKKILLLAEKIKKIE